MKRDKVSNETRSRIVADSATRMGDACQERLSSSSGALEGRVWVGAKGALAQLLLGRRRCNVNLVAEDEEGHGAEVILRQQRVELGLGLGEALVVRGVD